MIYLDVLRAASRITTQNGNAELQQEIKSCQSATPFIFKDIDTSKIDGLSCLAADKFSSFDINFPYPNMLFEVDNLNIADVQLTCLFHVQKTTIKDAIAEHVKIMSHMNNRGYKFLDRNTGKTTIFEYVECPYVLKVTTCFQRSSSCNIPNIPNMIVWIIPQNERSDAVLNYSIIPPWISNEGVSILGQNLGCFRDIIWRITLSLLLLLNTKGIITESHDLSDKMNQKRISKGKQPLPAYNIVKIKPRQERINLGGTHSSPRPHERMGHYRVYSSGKKIWIEKMFIKCSDESEIVPHHYVLEDSNSFIDALE